MRRIAFLCALLLAVSHPVYAQANDVQVALASMDKLATGLRTLSFRFRLLTVEGQNAKETHRGIVRVVGLEGGDYEALVEIERPAGQRIYYRGRQLLIVDAVNKETNEMELEEYAALVSPLKLLMLGTAGTRVAAAYDITAGRSENIGSVTATKLELRPKAPEVRGYMEKVELWVPVKGGFPVRLELMLSGLMRFEFSDVKVNPKLPVSLRPK
jgi:outer membrane lipoprotein-sorting protein